VGERVARVMKAGEWDVVLHSNEFAQRPQAQNLKCLACFIDTLSNVMVYLLLMDVMPAGAESVTGVTHRPCARHWASLSMRSTL
jgi:hypothetical protein